MAGIYIHIPYCKKACFYCNFHFSTKKSDMENMVNAICKEIELKSQYLENQIISTVYFGGGTPSLLSNVQLIRIIDKVKKYWKFSNRLEMTIEVNPDDCSINNLKNWSEIGFNRLSIGLQSFYDEDLKYMNRAHKGKESIESIESALKVGFNDLSIDLIYGFPILTNEKWLSNLSKLNDYPINHLSCYALTLEQGTPLQKMINTGKATIPNEENQSDQFNMLTKWAIKNNWEHYEISNFAKNGNYSKHNTSYWQGQHYLGLGPAAHSFNGESRSWNINDNAVYIENISNNGTFFETEILTPNSKLNEFLLTGLRTKWGIDTQIAEQIYAGWEKVNEKAISKYIKLGLIQINGRVITLTQKGKYFADGIAADLFITE